MPFLKHKRLWTGREFHRRIAIALGVVLLTTTLPFPLPALAAQVSADSLVGYWKFDETSGTSAADSSGDGNSGTHTNSPTISTDVPTTAFTNGRSLSFDGTDDYVDAGNSSTLQAGTQNWTISSWVKTSTTTRRALISSVDAAALGFYVDVLATGPVRTGFEGPDDNFVYRDSSVNVNDNVWRNVVVTWNFSTKALSVYIDGIDRTTGGGTAGTVTNVLNGSSIKIGETLLSSDPFSGVLDDVRIYSRALSAGEIAELAAGNHTTAVWDGSSSTDWETAANWDTSAVPDPFTHVIIRSGPANRPLMTLAESG
ncbi:MAG: LamG domain-containing protein, partial [Patescibacteria group bacterium]